MSSLPPPPPVIHRDPLDISGLIDVLAERITDFTDALLRPLSSLTPVETTLGRMMPLGIERLAICELFADLLRRNNPQICDKFRDNRVMTHVFDLFFQFPWNNLLHMIACDMVNSICEGSLGESESALILSVSGCKLLFASRI